VKRPVRLLCTAAFLGALVVGVPGVASAASSSTTCTGDLAPGTYHRVVVPAGAVCLSGGPVTIRGGLYIESGATFVLGSEEHPVGTGNSPAPHVGDSEGLPNQLTGVKTGQCVGL
jgi:hypothetical protein